MEEESYESCDKNNAYVSISNWYDVRVFYKYNSETKQILEKLSDSIFKFHFHYEGKPENPTFYREDYSVLFASVTHDGDSFLFPKENEDVSVVLNNKHWICGEVNDGY